MNKPSTALLEAVKNYLDITWDMTPGEEEKLSGIVTRGMSSIAQRIPNCDFETETPEKALLFDYVMYVRSGVLDQFWENYSGEIVGLQIGRWDGDGDATEEESTV